MQICFNVEVIEGFYYYISNKMVMHLTQKLTFIFIFIVCPSLKLRSSLGPASNGFAASIFSCSSRFTTLNKYQAQI